MRRVGRDAFEARKEGRPRPMSSTVLPAERRASPLEDDREADYSVQDGREKTYLEQLTCAETRPRPSVLEEGTRTHATYSRSMSEMG
jgi:hypothetical protein